jgi:rifampicin phosphotransferase
MHSNKSQTSAQVIKIDDFLPEVHPGGGKAQGLYKLTKHGLKVPKTWVILNADICSDHNALVSESSIEPHDGLFAVRSSAMGEDGANDSFAGMFMSVLSVTYGQIHGSLSSVLNSLSASHAVQYQKIRNTKASGMSVVVQHMIDSEYAGVLFTRSPIEGDRSIFIAEVVRGLGEQLVSGKVSPLSLRINIRTGVTRVVQEGVQKISESELWFMDQLIDSCRSLRDSSQTELDVEWCTKGENLYFLQARPITACSGL